MRILKELVLKRTRVLRFTGPVRTSALQSCSRRDRRGTAEGGGWGPGSRSLCVEAGPSFVSRGVLLPLPLEETAALGLVHHFHLRLRRDWSVRVGGVICVQLPIG